MSDDKHIPTLQSGVVIPAAQSVLTGLLIGATAIFGWRAWQTPTGAQLFLAVFAGGTFCSWILLLLRWLTWIDAAAGSEPPATVYLTETKQLHLSIDWDAGRAGLFDDLSISDEQFIGWSCATARGASLGENWWTGAANPFSKGTYHAFLTRMITHGMVKPRGKARTSGYILTAMGRAVTYELLRRYGDGDHSPTRRGYLPATSKN